MEFVRKIDGGFLVDDEEFEDDVRVHIRTVKSSEHDTKRLEVEPGLDSSRSKSIPQTVDVWPVRTAQHVQSSTSSLYRRMVSSYEEEAKSCTYS